MKMHSNFPIKRVIIEGTDLAGKSSLISELHKKTNYLYNLIDRSFLSRVCYARQFGRNVEKERHDLLEELSNMNNRVIVLFPEKKEIIRRYRERGDVIQNEDSLNILWDIYYEEIQKIKHFPNVFVIDFPYSWKIDYITEDVCDYLLSTSYFTPIDAGYFVGHFVNNLENKEAIIDLQLSILDDYYDDQAIFRKPSESEYYLGIQKKCIETIKNEIDGKNPYNLPQTIDSRRFYYGDDTCISSIHFLPRNDLLKVMCVLRSTDVDRNAESDLAFLASLSSTINRNFGWECNTIELNIRLNCAHVRTDLKT